MRVCHSARQAAELDGSELVPESVRRVAAHAERPFVQSPELSTIQGASPESVLLRLLLHRMTALRVLCLALALLLGAVPLRGHDEHDVAQGGNVPIIDIAPLFWKSFPQFFHYDTIVEIRRACIDVGFFYIKGMPVDSVNMATLEAEAMYFFGKPEEEKRRIELKRAGKAWRGYFSVGEELTSGVPDNKQGLYFGVDEDGVGKGPLRGRNQYPERPYVDSATGKEAMHLLFERSVPLHLDMMRQIGQALMQAVALSLDLPHDTLNRTFSTPTELFRIFSYPPPSESSDVALGLGLGVGEHTDYGYLTILWQDGQGGLQVRNASTHDWIDVSPLEGTYVVNLGDALEHYTGGLFRATPHRVKRTPSSSPRLSMPYFFDPSFDAPMTSVVDRLPPETLAIIQARRRDQAQAARWDAQDPTLWQGTYGDYLQKKISKVFPELFASAGLKSPGGDEL